MRMDGSGAVYRMGVMSNPEVWISRGGGSVMPDWLLTTEGDDNMLTLTLTLAGYHETSTSVWALIEARFGPMEVVESNWMISFLIIGPITCCFVTRIKGQQLPCYLDSL